MQNEHFIRVYIVCKFMTEKRHNVEISTYDPLNTKRALHHMIEIDHDLEISTSHNHGQSHTNFINMHGKNASECKGLNVIMHKIVQSQRKSLNKACFCK